MIKPDVKFMEWNEFVKWCRINLSLQECIYAIVFNVKKFGTVDIVSINSTFENIPENVVDNVDYVINNLLNDNERKYIISYFSSLKSLHAISEETGIKYSKVNEGVYGFIRFASRGILGLELQYGHDYTINFFKRNKEIADEFKSSLNCLDLSAEEVFNLLKRKGSDKYVIHVSDDLELEFFQLGVSLRVGSALARKNLFFVYDLDGLTLFDIRNIRNIHKVSIIELFEKILPYITIEEVA